METIERIDLSVLGSPLLIARELSEYATLKFLAVFDLQAVPKSQTNHIYCNGTPEALLSVELFYMKPRPLLMDMY